MPKALITTVPFGEKSKKALDLLSQNNIDYLINPLNKKLTENELAEMVTDFDVIIAGTEPITKKVMDWASNLKMISRVGIGLDSVNLLEAEQQGITVSYTPDAPAPAVAELTIGNIISLLRGTHLSNLMMHQKKELLKIQLKVFGLHLQITKTNNILQLQVYQVPQLASL